MRNEERTPFHFGMPPNTLCQGSTKQDTVRENPPQAVPMEHNVCTGISDVRYFSPRLLAALTGILSSPLTVIEAPMGYGKTVAVREFLRRENLARREELGKTASLLQAVKATLEQVGSLDRELAESQSRNVELMELAPIDDSRDTIRIEGETPQEKAEKLYETYLKGRLEKL